MGCSDFWCDECAGIDWNGWEMWECLGSSIYKTQEVVYYPIYVVTMQAGHMLVRVCIYGAGPANEVGFWSRDIGRVDVNANCGALFGLVFEQYGVVFVRSPEGVAHRLTRDTNLGGVLTMLNMRHVTAVNIWAEYRED